VPTADDVLALNALDSTPLDEKGIKERMELWGPIPRHVLIDCSREEQLDLWKRVQGVSLDALVALARAQASSHGGGDELDARHRIVQERAAGQDAEPGTPAADPTPRPRSVMRRASSSSTVGGRKGAGALLRGATAPKTGRAASAAAAAAAAFLLTFLVVFLAGVAVMAAREAG
jgi:hypothetical protein